MKAAFRSARAEVVPPASLVLWFGSDIIREKAVKYPHAIEPLVKGWLGDSATIEYRLEATDSQTPAAARRLAPEEHPMVLDAMRKLEGTVTEVRKPRS